MRNVKVLDPFKNLIIDRTVKRLDLVKENAKYAEAQEAVKRFLPKDDRSVAMFWLLAKYTYRAKNQNVKSAHLYNYAKSETNVDKDRFYCSKPGYFVSKTSIIALTVFSPNPLTDNSSLFDA